MHQFTRINVESLLAHYAPKIFHLTAYDRDDTGARESGTERFESVRQNGFAVKKAILLGE